MVQCSGAVVVYNCTLVFQLPNASRRDIVSIVKDWDGVKVVTLEKVLRAVEKHRHLISGEAISQSNLVVCIRYFVPCFTSNLAVCNKAPIYGHFK